MRFLIEDLFSYLKYPYLTGIPAKVEEPVQLMVRLTLICLVTGVGAGLLVDRLVAFHLLASPGSSLAEHTSMSKPVLFVFAVIVAPIWEELVFRGTLRRFTASLLFISAVPGTILTELTGTAWAYLVSPFLFVILFLLYRFNLAESITRKYRFWTRLFPWYFHFTTLCFALIHLSNYEKGISLLPFGLLYTLPQLMIGLILGYTRMRYGLKYSMVLHGMYNFVPMAMYLLSLH